VRHIKAIDAGAKIIVASGFIDPSIKSALMKSGVMHFVFKPYSANEILKILRVVIEGK
jgi:DNA-binding NarL/FixJ family response regulator